VKGHGSPSVSELTLTLRRG